MDNRRLRTTWFVPRVRLVAKRPGRCHARCHALRADSRTACAAPAVAGCWRNGRTQLVRSSPADVQTAGPPAPNDRPSPASRDKRGPTVAQRWLDRSPLRPIDSSRRELHRGVVPLEPFPRIWNFTHLPAANLAAATQFPIGSNGRATPRPQRGSSIRFNDRTEFPQVDVDVCHKPPQAKHLRRSCQGHDRSQSARRTSTESQSELSWTNKPIRDSRDIYWASQANNTDADRLSRLGGD